MCLCGGDGCRLPTPKPTRNHFCTVCNRPHYLLIEAEDCCDMEVVCDD